MNVSTIRSSKPEPTTVASITAAAKRLRGHIWDAKVRRPQATALADAAGYVDGFLYNLQIISAKRGKGIEQHLVRAGFCMGRLHDLANVRARTDRNIERQRWLSWGTQALDLMNVLSDMDWTQDQPTILDCGCSTVGEGQRLKLNIGCQQARDLYGPVSETDMAYHEALAVNELSMTPEQRERNLDSLLADKVEAWGAFCAHFGREPAVLGGR